jgi:hypothetical protein
MYEHNCGIVGIQLETTVKHNNINNTVLPNNKTIIEFGLSRHLFFFLLVENEAMSAIFDLCYVK